MRVGVNSYALNTYVSVCLCVCVCIPLLQTFKHSYERVFFYFRSHQNGMDSYKSAFHKCWGHEPHSRQMWLNRRRRRKIACLLTFSFGFLQLLFSLTWLIRNLNDRRSQMKPKWKKFLIPIAVILSDRDQLTTWVKYIKKMKREKSKLKPNTFLWSYNKFVTKFCDHYSISNIVAVLTNSLDTSVFKDLFLDADVYLNWREKRKLFTWMKNRQRTHTHIVTHIYT